MRKRKRVDDRCWLLLQTTRGPELVEGRRSPENGVEARGCFYPDEFLVPLGRENYFLATHCYMPKDGDLTVNAGDESLELVEVPQLHYIAHWREYDAARRRLNWAMVWRKGDGSATALKNLMYACILMMAIWTSWQVSGFKSLAARIQDQQVVLSGQIARISGEQPPLGQPPKGVAQPNGTLVPDPGMPTGDK
ncbi:hypothetical protein [Kallotenue papyrolyticum]|uniref:hypothetical protein n=1 Tax=Kallotenue papyrolyticum TaxID=1325125 RepID=UPI000492C7FA|nr:hypothetical protein [Kallotenue papyrolyticum]